MADRKKYDKEYRKNNKEKCLNATKKWLKNNPEYKKEYNSIPENRDRANGLRRKRYKENPECKKNVNKSSRKWYQNNEEKILVKHFQYRKDNQDKIKKYQGTEECKASKQRNKTKTRAGERNIINTLTSKEWLDLLEKYDFRCAYCDVEFDCENLPTRDHVIPINKGGENTKDNVVPACRSCNAKKHNKILIGEING
jgi:5-methylcytosine-specific restriction endonuclease McrA